MAEMRDLSLKSLEVFQACARCGSLSAAANAMAISTSTITHHIKKIENHLGIELFDHGKKPLSLTSTGESFLAEIEPALQILRQAQANANAEVMQSGRQFRFGAIEDFETEIVPDLAVFLNEKLPKMDFSYQIETSLTLLDMMRDRALDIGIMARPSAPIAAMTYQPILRDPFVIVVPESCDFDAEQFLSGKTDIPYLQFHHSQMISQQIEAQLQRMQIKLPKRMRLGNNATLMALVAAGSGWAITTPLLYAHSKRSHENVRLINIPKQQFAREIGIFSSDDCPNQMLEMVRARLYELLHLHAIEPVHTTYPWLEDHFTIIN
jgi:DNA-binding transcriptional LysR family regulator